MPPAFCRSYAGLELAGAIQTVPGAEISRGAHPIATRPCARGSSSVNCLVIRAGRPRQITPMRISATSRLGLRGLPAVLRISPLSLRGEGGQQVSVAAAGPAPGRRQMHRAIRLRESPSRMPAADGASATSGLQQSGEIRGGVGRQTAPGTQSSMEQLGPFLRPPWRGPIGPSHEGSRIASAS